MNLLSGIWQIQIQLRNQKFPQFYFLEIQVDLWQFSIYHDKNFKAYVLKTKRSTKMKKKCLEKFQWCSPLTNVINCNLFDCSFCKQIKPQVCYWNIQAYQNSRPFLLQNCVSNWARSSQRRRAALFVFEK